MKKFILFALFFVLILGPNYAAFAQGITIHGVEPKQGHATGSIKSTCTNLVNQTFDRSLNVSISFWNVGKLGGEKYKNLTLILTGVEDSLQCTQGVTTLTLSFDGGPNGNASGFNLHLVTGRYFQLTFREYTAQIQVDDPSIFDGWTDEEPAETPEDSGTACTPNVRGLDPQKPGDVISPGATYLSPDGSDVGVIQERWYINGQETNSLTWDGKQTTVELQWTCLDHKGYSQIFEIPAYQAVQPPGQSDNQAPTTPAIPNSGDIFSGLGILLIGLGGVAGLGGAIGLGGSIIHTLTTGSTPAAAVTPPAQPAPLPANPPTRTPGKLDPSLKKPWELKLNDLIDQRTKIQAKIQSTNQSIDKMTHLYKNNILKVIMKGGAETGQIIFDAVTGGGAEIPNLAIEIGKKSLNDKITDKIFQKHDSSQDGKKVVNLKDLIDQLKNQRDQMRNQVKDINHEIKGIQEHMQENF
jgi:hypothetical protein